MSRLQKKCLMMSTGAHLLLALIVVIGPGFMSSDRTLDNLPELNFVPSVLVDAAVAGGGNPNAKPPPAVTPTPTPPPVQASAPPPEPKPAPKVREPEPLPEPVKESKPVADSLEPSETKRKMPNIPTALVERSRTTPKTNSQAAEQAKAEERRAADARRRLAGEIARAANSIRAGTGSATAIEEIGPGGGGPAYASYKAWVQTVYMNAWVPPEEASVDAAVVVATVTIARDGTILSKSILTRSGNPEVDSSVQRTLDRVVTIGRPFPDGAKEPERSYKLRFDVKAKQGMA